MTKISLLAHNESKGFTYRKEVTTGFKKHKAGDCHRDAIEVVILPEQVRGDVCQVVGKAHHGHKATDRIMFSKILRFITKLPLLLTNVNCNI